MHDQNGSVPMPVVVGEQISNEVTSVENYARFLKTENSHLNDKIDLSTKNNRLLAERNSSLCEENSKLRKTAIEMEEHQRTEICRKDVEIEELRSRIARLKNKLAKSKRKNKKMSSVLKGEPGESKEKGGNGDLGTKKRKLGKKSGVSVVDVDIPIKKGTKKAR
ncbi:MAG: hypothetical protein LBR91_01625 [Puniceicoccales bacterium]|jgi:predicted RNase H-like nuclease (RuvC/YqgF family)|nr:hypothetical protein [Puniceicoccales bacterium]